jgi:AcrR family transcriptional regulator
MRKTRTLLRQQDWIEAAIDELSTKGLDGLAVEPLARRLQVSKGSFYWHFRDRQELLEAVLDYWKSRAFTQVVSELSPIRDSRKRLAALIQTAWSNPRHLRAEGALISAASTGNKPVQRVVREVVNGRIDYLRSLYLEMGLKPEDAARWAVIAYSAYAGLVQLVAMRAGPITSEAEIQALAEQIERVLIPANRVRVATRREGLVRGTGDAK